MAIERKEKLIRILQIMNTTDEKSPVNANDLIKRLDIEYELGKIDRRSIYRDITMLQYCGYPIEQCMDKRKGWYMDKHAFEDWEIKIMMDSIQQAKCISTREAIVIKEKLLNLTSKRGRSRLLHIMIPKQGNVEGNTTIGNNIEMMLEAIYQHKKIQFQYTEITDNMKKVLRREGKQYNLNLFTIYWSSNNYYLIGCHDNHDGLTHYRLDRMDNLRITNEDAISANEKIGPNPEHFIQEYIERSVNNFSGDIIHIELEYEPNPITNAILYDFIGEEISVKKQSNGLYKVSFIKMNSVALRGWLLQYANRFKVLAPECLQSEIINELNRATKKYDE